MFIAITTERKDTRLVLIQTTAGQSLYNAGGITTREALEFLVGLARLKKRKAYKGCKFVWFASTFDVELLLQDLTDNQKDRIFQAANILHEISLLEYEQENQKDVIASKKANQADKEAAKIEHKKLDKSLRDFQETKVLPFSIRYKAGRSITVKSGKDTITVFDAYGFFRTTLKEAVNNWSKQDAPECNIKPQDTIDLLHATQEEKLKAQAIKEGETIVNLMDALDVQLKSIGVNLKNYHGAGAIANHLLSKWKVRQNYRVFTRQNLNPLLYKACMSGNFGGRQEQLKLGTFENVYVYDINSAYAYALSTLPKTFHFKYQEKLTLDPFGLWFVDYDFSDALYYGLLPHRNTSISEIIFKAKGRGWYYTPEIRTLMRHAPANSFEILYGYTCEYKEASFQAEVESLYNSRLETPSKALADLIKLSLASLYGKFAQSIGEASFRNPFYAGYITSFCRSQIVEAAASSPESVIAFTQDGIHTTQELPLELSDSLGGWKMSKYKQVTYLTNGVYMKKDFDGRVSFKMRGYNMVGFDYNTIEGNISREDLHCQGFARAIEDFKEQHFFEAYQEFMSGWKRASNISEKHTYLNAVTRKDVINPMASRQREFTATLLDFSNGYIDSRMIIGGDKESVEYRPQRLTNENDLMLDFVNARRG